MPILNYTTKVDVHISLGEIQGQLAKHGARRIVTDYDDSGEVTSISFIIDTPNGMNAVRLPANVEAVKKVLENQKVKCDMVQARRVAWRILKDWVLAQMAILESAMVTMDQIFLPYMVNGATDETVYDMFVGKTLSLEAGAE